MEIQGDFVQTSETEDMSSSFLNSMYVIEFSLKYDKKIDICW